MLVKDKYYILHGAYIYTGQKAIDVPYVDLKSIFLRKTYFTQYFTEYSRIKEPMLFDYNEREIFTGITVKQKLIKNKNPNSPDFKRYQLDCNFNLSNYTMPNTCLMANDICDYPFVLNYDEWYKDGLERGRLECYCEINGTLLKNLIIRIKDYDSSEDNPTFTRHEEILLTNFKNACVSIGLPYKTPSEYANYVKQLDIERINKLTSQEDDINIRKILSQYSS